MPSSPHNKPRVHAFIDAQNVLQATRAQGWQFGLQKLRIYLADKYKVTNAYYFIGYIPRNQRVYAAIQRAGYIVQFKEVATLPNGEIKGNIDVNLTLHAVDTVNTYDKAVLVSADGDFSPLVQYWQSKDKFRAILSPASANHTSRFLKRDAQGQISFMPNLRRKLER